MSDTNLDKKVAGSIKEAIGKVTGDVPLQTAGEADKVAADQASTEKPDRV